MAFGASGSLSLHIYIQVHDGGTSIFMNLMRALVPILMRALQCESKISQRQKHPKRVFPSRPESRRLKKQLSQNDKNTLPFLNPFDLARKILNMAAHILICAHILTSSLNSKESVTKPKRHVSFYSALNLSHTPQLCPPGNTEPVLKSRDHKQQPGLKQMLLQGTYCLCT